MGQHQYPYGKFKVCKVCDKRMSVDKFYLLRKTYRMSYCKSCTSVYNRRRYLKSKRKQNAKRS